MVRYFDEHAINTLLSRKLKVSAPTELNDPFEFLLNHEGYDHLDEHIRNCADRNIRILSMCDPDKIEDSGDALMWSHYARSHKGFRIHFDKKIIERHCIDSMEISYLKEIPEWKSCLDPDSEEYTDSAAESISAALSAKGDIWRYEEETRFFFDTESCRSEKINNKILYFIELDPSAVRRIDIGLNTDQRLADTMKKIVKGDHYFHTSLFKTSRRKGKYALQYEKID